MNTKVIVLLGAAACVALLLWFLGRQSVSEGVAEVPAPSSLPMVESTPEPEIQLTEREHRQPDAVADELPAVVRPEDPADTTNKDVDFWPRIQDVTGAIFDGTARAEDIVALSKELLSVLDLSSASKR